MMSSDNYIGESQDDTATSFFPANQVIRQRLDYTPFVSPKFDVNAYANAILAGETYDPEEIKIAVGLQNDRRSSVQAKGKARETAMDGLGMAVKGDIGVALARLNYGIVSEL